MNRLDAIKARAEAATPGPWEWENPYRLEQPLEFGQVVTYIDQFESKPSSADRTFIAHARADIPALLAVAEAALVAINGLLSTGWLMDSLTAEEGWTGEPNSHQWLYDAIVAADDALRPLLEPDR